MSSAVMKLLTGGDNIFFACHPLHSLPRQPQRFHAKATDKLIVIWLQILSKGCQYSVAEEMMRRKGHYTHQQLSSSPTRTLVSTALLLSLLHSLPHVQPIEINNLLDGALGGKGHKYPQNALWCYSSLTQPQGQVICPEAR